MGLENCVRCGREIGRISARQIHGLYYCPDCAEQSKYLVDEKKADVQEEEEQLVQERDVIEKEMSLVSEEDTRHIIVTSTDMIEGRRILEYMDVISVQNIEFQIIHFDPVQAEGQNSLAEKSFRSSVELCLSKIKKRAYLTGADAVVGVRIDSSMDHQREGEYMAAVMSNINVSGTAVRLAPDSGNHP